MASQVAKIINKGPGDNTLILNTRCQLVYPFSAPNWNDLRVGFFLSLCSTAIDDPPSPITGLAETLTLGGLSFPQEYPWIGIKTNNDSLPIGQNVGFIGYSSYPLNNAVADLTSSDGAIGTTNAFFWRPRNTGTLGHPDDATSAVVMDHTQRVAAFTNVNPHFAQVADGTSTHPYATLLMLRILRTAQSQLTISINQGTNSGDVLFTNTPTLDLLENNLANYPATVQTKIVNNMANIPDALYLYWPFHNSRLRIHAMGFMKFR